MGSGVLDHDTINCCDQPERHRIRKLFARRPSHLTLNKMIWLLNTYQVLNHSWKGPACTRWPSPGDATRKYEAVDRAWFFLLALVHTHQLPSLKAEACWRDDQVSRRVFWLLSLILTLKGVQAMFAILQPCLSVIPWLLLKSKEKVWFIKNGCITSGGGG